MEGGKTASVLASDHLARARFDYLPTSLSSHVRHGGVVPFENIPVTNLRCGKLSKM